MKVQLPVRQAILNRRTYEAPAEGRSGKVRLDFNENTSGCSPTVQRLIVQKNSISMASLSEPGMPISSPIRRTVRRIAGRVRYTLGGFSKAARSRMSG